MQIVKESVFISIIRSFFSGLFGMIGVLIGLAILAFVFMTFAVSSAHVPPQRYDLTPMADATGNIPIAIDDRPYILNIDIQGVIGMKFLTSERFNEMMTALEGPILKQKKLAGILLNINSPGGSVIDTHNMYVLIKKIAKKKKVPVYAYTDGMMASGGYYLACSADKIFSNEIALIGSVGVLSGPNFNFKGLMNTYGIDSVTYTEGKDKVPLPMFETWDPQKPNYNKTIVENYYNIFTNVVTSARKGRLSKSNLEQKYGASVYVGQEAFKRGYVDNANFTLNEALLALAKEAKVANFQAIKVSYRPQFQDLFLEQNTKAWIRSLFSTDNDPPQFLYRN